MLEVSWKSLAKMLFFYRIGLVRSKISGRNYINFFMRRIYIFHTWIQIQPFGSIIRRDFLSLSEYPKSRQGIYVFFLGSVIGTISISISVYISISIYIYILDIYGPDLFT